MSETFESMPLNDTIQEVIRLLYFKQPTKIQQEVIPAVLEGKSVIGKSQTGSGKTHAYLIPLMNQIEEDRQEVQMVITLPTRELAQQIHMEVKKMIELAQKEQVWTTRLLIGGTDRQKLAEKLEGNPPHIVVGTPGRILDLVKEGALSIYSAHAFVIDEADLMLDLGFIHEVDQLLVRAKQDIQILAFSATIPERLSHFLKKYLENPLYIDIKQDVSPEQMTHRLVALKHRDPADLIVKMSKIFQPYLAMIFTNGKEQANELAGALQEKGLDAGLIHGGLSPRERKRALKDILDLRYQYVVATDLASRGIDIPGVSHVINAHLPKEEEFYVHRVGRTARAGLQGEAISLYTEEDLALIEKLETKGITFVYSDIKEDQWVDATPWNKRQMRKKSKDSLDEIAWKMVKKPKKIKPGYKKKLRQQQERIKRQLKKKHKRFK